MQQHSEKEGWEEEQRPQQALVEQQEKAPDGAVAADGVRDGKGREEEKGLQ